MDLDPKLFQQLVDAFKVELEEQLQIITDGLLQLEKKRQGAEVRRQTLDNVFRAAHNIKGAAKGVGVEAVSTISHALESLLSALRQTGRKPSPQHVDLSLEAVDQMRTAMRAFVDGEGDASQPGNLLGRLEQASTTITDTKPPMEPESRTSKPPPKTDDNTDTPPKETARKGGGGAVVVGEVVRVATEKLERVGALAEELQVAKIEMEDHFTGIQQLRNETDQLAQLWRQSFHHVKRAGMDALPVEIRRLLTNSMDGINELNVAVRHMYTHMRGTTTQLGYVSTALQDDVRKLRMVPATTVLQPLARTVRDIARQYGKEVSLEITGDELELDRLVLEGIRDPLLHLARNAIDHGIEDAGVRAQRGKPAEGTMRIKLQAEGGQAVIQVEDDGAGMDPQVIAAAAVKKGLVSSSDVEGMGRQELLELIFRPGFSTKEIITDLSGRGVGLDVVLTNLKMLKGNLSIDTEPGQGTTFTLRLPFTLAAEHGLLVRCGGKLLAIPVTSLERIMEVTPQEVVNVEGSQALRINEQPVLLRELATVLEMPATEPLFPDKLFVVVVSKGWRTIALIVDEIVGEREIVIKPLKPPLMAVRNVAGATLTGTGEVIMVLNPSDLVESALHASAHLRLPVLSVTKAKAKAKQILVVDDSITTRTLERNILEAHGYTVTVAVDGKEAWDVLQTKEFDLLVTDIEMPVMDGFELTQQVKQNEKFKGLPVIIVTSRATDADKQRGIDVGADAYIVKSHFETKALLDVVKQLI